VDIVKPRALPANARVGVIAPASAPRADHSFAEGLDGLRSASFDVVLGRNEISGVGYLAGTDEERLTELNTMLGRDDLDALICVRGGYGVLRILDYVDFDAARALPKLIVGYSDITALQLALWTHARLPSISGPMVAVEWHDPDGMNCAHFRSMASSTMPAGSLDPNRTLRTMVAGSADGTLIGGNLTLISRLCGTRHCPDFDGTILFLEEIGEIPYRVDGLLAQLELAGILDGLAGVVLGAFTEDGQDPSKPTLSLPDIFEDYFGGLGIPVATGLQYGHIHDKVAVPIGVQARLSCTASGASLEVLESPVS